VYTLPVAKELQEDIGANEDFWNTITTEIFNKCQEIPYVSIALLGGESLIQPGAIRLINWLIDNNLSKKIILRLTTNFTNIKDNIVKNFNQFKLVSICASIDSVNENYSYVRYPEKFNTIATNLELIIKNKNNPNMNFYITPVWSLHNIFYIVDYLTWWNNWFEENNIYNISIGNVSMSEPHIMTVQNLPIEYRKHLLSIVLQAVAHDIFKNPKHSSLKEYLTGLITFLSGKNIVYDKFTEFLKQTAKDDRATNMNMSIENSKLYNILNSNDQQIYNQFRSNIG
jgi:hypothetical protein